MEDFMVVSVLDLELDEGRVVQKNKVHYYIMSGDECIDSLILGPSNAQTQVNQ
jgi:hypothetical protein